MFLLVAVILVIILFILLQRSFNKYASGLREPPGYFHWFATLIINYKGWSREDYCLSTTDIKSDKKSGYLSDKNIPKRNQSRPKMLRALPNRQLTQHAPDDIMYEMYKYIQSISIPKCGGETINKNLLLRGKSSFEYTGADAIYLPNVDQKRFDKGEVGHIHSNDGSFHIILHPSDAKLLIDQEWAERFPLFGVNLFNKIIVPDTYVLVYAPQNEDELNIWKTILHAGIDYNRDIEKNK